MTRTYQGACHCGAVRFEADLDLTNETSRCNCSICAKTRLWKARLAPTAVRLLQGADAMSEYRFGSRAVRHQFCRICGVKMFGHFTDKEGAHVVISIATLVVLDSELGEACITYQDGRSDAFARAPLETRYL
jgi:hypothetical protein